MTLETGLRDVIILIIATQSATFIGVVGCLIYSFVINFFYFLYLLRLALQHLAVVARSMLLTR